MRHQRNEHKGSRPDTMKGEGKAAEALGISLDELQRALMKDA